MREGESEGDYEEGKTWEGMRTKGKMRGRDGCDRGVKGGREMDGE